MRLDIGSNSSKKDNFILFDHLNYCILYTFSIKQKSQQKYFLLCIVYKKKFQFFISLCIEIIVAFVNKILSFKKNCFIVQSERNTPPNYHINELHRQLSSNSVIFSQFF